MPARSCPAGRRRRCRRRPRASSAPARGRVGRPGRATARTPRPGRTPPPACRRCTRGAPGATPAAPRRWAPPARRTRPCARPSRRRARRAPWAATAACPWPRTPPGHGLGRRAASSATTTSPTFPVASFRSPTASATSPWTLASWSRASATPSSNVRPLAAPRSRSTSSSSSFSRSSRSACTCFSSSAIWRSSACWLSFWRWSAAFSTRIVPALKSASGLLPSAEENCFIRSSRERAIVSCTSSRTRFCTDAELPSENSFSSSLARWPLSGPKTSSTRSLKYSATVRARSVNCAFSSVAARSNSVFTNSALAPACSRSSTRAPISTASRTTFAASSPFCSRSRTSLTAHSSSTTRPSIVRRSPTVRICAALSGVAASIVLAAPLTSVAR